MAEPAAKQAPVAETYTAAARDDSLLNIKEAFLDAAIVPGRDRGGYAQKTLIIQYVKNRREVIKL